MSIDTETQEQQDDRPGGLPAWVKPVGLLAAVVVLIVVARVFNLGEKLEQVRLWIDRLGPWAPVAFIAVYIGATVIAIPGTPLTVAAGALFHPALGIVWVSIASTAGAAVCFIIARYLARDSVRRSLEGRPKFEKLDRMTGEHGATIVAIVRLVPLFPFNLQNYGFGLTRVKFWQYVIISWLCMLPMTAVYVLIGAGVAEGLEEGGVPWSIAGAVAVLGIALVIIIQFARSKLKAAAEETPGLDAEEIERNLDEEDGDE
jgi:uncharacterized membrane protein YdjX (TVP38/TMEM64 family)